ncbi:MAG: single-stranded-DNA-specific exonuclease RecJ [Anaerolineales bacterium]
MPSLAKHWLILNKLTPQADQNLAGYPPLLRQALFNRGLGTAEESKRYLAALPPEVNDPFRMKGMGTAVDRLVHAIQSGETVIVYGDYDADGVTATALLLHTIQALGGKAQPYIPDRFEEGYGLNVGALQQLKEGGASVVVTVDCGVRSLKEAEEAKRLGLDLIITDHHSVGPELPNAFALINTKQPGCEYPEKQLAGVGTAFKLACALEARLRPVAIADGSMLDLVALGTVADMVPLTGENRWMVREGLARLRKPQRQGVLSLIGVSGLKPTAVSAGDIGYLLGPRLNAAGRLETAKNALNLLMTNDVFEAGRLAQYLDSQNRERQELTRQMTESAEGIAAAQGDALLLVALQEEYNPGVVGLVASRLVERFYRPAIVGQRGAEYTRASCRSIPEFHITRALESCADLFQNFGGHAAAAGFTVRNDRLPEALERLQAIAREQLSGKDLFPVLVADAEVPLSELKADVIQHFELIEPTGYGNPQVSLVSRGLQVLDARVVGQEGKHLKLTVTDGWITYDAIAFRQGHWIEALPKVVDLLYRFEANEFNGRSTLQLNVRDLKAST